MSFFRRAGGKVKLRKFFFPRKLYQIVSTRIANLTVSFTVDLCVERKHVFGTAAKDELKYFSTSLSSSPSFDRISLHSEGKKKCRQVVKVKVTIICLRHFFLFCLFILREI